MGEKAVFLTKTGCQVSDFQKLPSPLKVQLKRPLWQNPTLRIQAVPLMSAELPQASSVTSMICWIRVFTHLLSCRLRCHHMFLKTVNCSLFKQRHGESVSGQTCYGGTWCSQSHQHYMDSPDFSNCGLFCTCAAMNELLAAKIQCSYKKKRDSRILGSLSKPAGLVGHKTVVLSCMLHIS